MNVRVINPFYDKKEGVVRNLGDTFTVSEERFIEINSTKFGILVEKAAEAAGVEKDKRKKSNKK